MALTKQAVAGGDPILQEIIRNLFISAAEEMKINLARAAYNPVVFEMYDFAVGIFDAEANMIAQAPGLPVFLGTLRENVKVITEDIGGLDKFRPGDLYMMNDPYAGGTHLLDVTCVVPVFDHDEVVGFSVAKMHWLYVGGKDPGNWSNDSLSIFGGEDGAANDAVFRPGMHGEKEVRKVTNFPLKSGEILSIRSGGDGGFGYPWRRDPSKVLDDVLDGYISVVNARKSYKVALVRKRNGFRIDGAATESLRRNRNRGRKTASPLLQ